MKIKKRKTESDKLSIIAMMLVFLLSISFLSACTSISNAAGILQDDQENVTKEAVTDFSDHTSKDWDAEENLPDDIVSSEVKQSSSRTTLARKEETLESEPVSSVSQEVTETSNTQATSSESQSFKPAGTQTTKPVLTTKADSGTKATSPASEATTAKATTTKSSTSGNITVYLSINCVNAVNANIPAAAPYAPDGTMLSNAAIAVRSGSTALDVLQKSNFIINANNNFLGSYISSIQGISEGAAGAGAGGWIYSINGEFPHTSSSNVTVKEGDRISFHYTVRTGDVPGSPY
ncbi:MAG: DUF4430 domain-containing protein [Eubacteriales bacterium]|nr:DUF4430 domain-containing protein [Eubacteriales bacterium]